MLGRRGRHGLDRVLNDGAFTPAARPLPENRVAVNAIFQTGDKASFRAGLVCRQQKRKAVQSHHILTENPLKILAACIFSCAFFGLFFASAAEHLNLPA
jgi:hypothetical protein